MGFKNRFYKAYRNSFTQNMFFRDKVHHGSPGNPTTLCGVRAVNGAYQTDSEVTCKRCLNSMAKLNREV